MQDTRTLRGATGAPLGLYRAAIGVGDAAPCAGLNCEHQRTLAYARAAAPGLRAAAPVPAKRAP